MSWICESSLRHMHLYDTKEKHAVVRIEVDSRLEMADCARAQLFVGVGVVCST